MTNSANKQYKSIFDIPVKVEMNVVNPVSEKVLTPEELQTQIEEARKGRAKVDSKYVGLADKLSHLFEYKYDYAGFLADMSYIIKKGKE